MFSFIRFLYTFVKIFREYSDNYGQGDKYQIDQRLRNDDFYNSLADINERVIESDE